MEEVRGEILQDKILLHLSGRIDSGNVERIEKSIRELIGEETVAEVDIDAAELKYISSAGLRMILKLKKNYPDLRILNANTDIYEILEMTGFTQMMRVEKAYRHVSVEGAEELGRGANGIVYRIGEDLVVKVFFNPDSLEDIRQERELARKALVLGIPTAISFDVVRVGDSYGSVYELLNAQSFSKILTNTPEKMDWCVSEYVDLLKLIHGISVPKGELPDARKTALDWAAFLQDHLPAEIGQKLSTLFEGIPETNTLLHGDYHTNNVELVGDEVLLIDMDTLSVGHPILELGSIFNAFLGFSEYDHSVIQKFQNFDWQTGKTFWQKFLIAYLGTDDEQKIRAVEDKAKIVGYTRMIRRSIRRHGLETEAGRAEIELWKSHLMEALDRVDTLDFSCCELKIEADQKNIPAVMAFMEKLLDEADCFGKTRMQILVAVEEIFVNIIHYAYQPGTGPAVIRADVSGSPAVLTVSFTDFGKSFDPLAKPDPDISLSAEEREIGGLGIFITRKLMDSISFESRDGKNILTMSKDLSVDSPQSSSNSSSASSNSHYEQEFVRRKITDVRRFDLHMHTNVSDGTDSPEEILENVRHASLELFSVTDHDAIQACRAIRSLLTEEDPLFISGVEFSCRDEFGKYHILGYGYDEDAEPMRLIVEKGHAMRMGKIGLRLNTIRDKFGINFSDNDISWLYSNNNPGKPHIANLMVQHGYAGSVKEAFTKFLNRAKTPPAFLLPEEAIDAIIRSGGIPILAHPAYGSGDELIVGKELEERLQRLISFGLQGVEAYYSRFSGIIQDELLYFAEKYGLYVTAGGDYHGKNKKISLGNTNLDAAPDSVPGLRRFLEDVPLR